MPGLIDTHGAYRQRKRWPGRRIQLAAPGESRVRRDDLARSVQRHRNRVHQQRADPHGRQARAAAVSRRARFSTAPRRRSPPRSSNYEDALAHLRRMKAAGAFSVKSYNQQRRDVRQMILKAARELQMEVVPEGGSLLLSRPHDGHGRPHDRSSTRCLSRTLPRRRRALVEDQGRLHADADRRIRRIVGRVLLVRARQRVGASTAPGVHATRRRRRAFAAPAQGGGRRRLQSRGDRAHGEEAGRRRRAGEHGRARAAPGPWRALGNLDGSAGWHDADSRR